MAGAGMNVAESKDIAQYLTFHLGDEVFAVDVMQVREILDFTEITRVPKTPEFMVGVINLRGSVVPVIDLRLKFGMEEALKTRDTCIIVMEVSIDGDTAVIGALADSVREVMELGREDIEPPPRIGIRMDTDFIHGMGKRDDRFLILLNIDRIFSTTELLLVQDVLEGHG